MSLFHIFLACLIVFLNAANAIVIKMALIEMPPVVFNAARFLLLLPLLFFFKRPLPYYKLILTGFLIYAISMACVGYALESGMGASMATILIQMSTFFTVFACYYIMNDIPKYNELLGLLIAYAGIALLSYNLSSMTALPLLTIVLVLIAAISQGVGFAFVRKYQVSSYFSFTIWISCLMFFPMAGLSFATEGVMGTLTYLHQASFKTWGILIFSSLIVTVFSIGLWVKLLKEYRPSILNSFLFLLAPFACLISAIFMGEVFTIRQTIASCAILAGVLVAQVPIYDTVTYLINKLRVQEDESEEETQKGIWN